MFVVVVNGPGRVNHRLQLSRTLVTIGSLPHSDIVLPPQTVAPQHARILVQDGRFVVVSLSFDAATRINGRRVGGPMVCRPTDQIEIGAYRLRLAFATQRQPPEPRVPVDPVELSLIEAIEKGDESSRLVYADWLEGNGHAAHAEFLRQQEKLVMMLPDEPGFSMRTDHLRDLAAQIDPAWRMCFARPPIERCLHAANSFACPQEWGALAWGEHHNERYCGSCKRSVFYCVTLMEGRVHTSRSNGVALDATIVRTENDLAGPYLVCPTCNLDIYPETLCPQCGHTVTRLIPRNPS